MNNHNKTDDPENIILILANPRSGSTWLLDALRSHPAISMPVQGMIYQRLNLHGRRYPRDLSDGSKASLQIEVRPDLGKWASIPDFKIDLPEDQRKLCTAFPNYAIEKIHPHFFDHKIRDFLSLIDGFGPSVQFRVLYLIRNPEDSLKSFFDYQTRNPNWNRNRKPGDVVVHMAEIYRTIYRMAKEYPGKCIDYLDLVNNPEQVFAEVLSWLWPGLMAASSLDIQLVISLMNQATKREKRANNQPFFGLKSSLFFEGETFEKLLQDNRKEFLDCKKYYQHLLDLIPE